MKAIEHLAQVLESLELEIPCDYLTDLDDVCSKTCNSRTGAKKECWLRYAEAREKQDAETPDCIPCGYIRAKENRDKAWKSLRHEDGELCFCGGWFIVGVDTPEGSYTYHYEDNYYSMFDCVELERAKHWDGHTEKDVTRLLSLPALEKQERETQEKPFPFVVGQPAEMFFNGKWEKGKIVAGYRFNDGVVTIETEDGRRLWCGQNRTDIYRPYQEDEA